MSSSHRLVRQAVAGTLLVMLAAAALPAASDAAVRKGCGGRGAQRIAAAGKVVVVEGERNGGDVYGGDHRFSGCYGQHGRTRTLLDFSSPVIPTLGRVALLGRRVALEVAVDDQACGKYLPAECRTLRYVSAWNAKTGRLTSQGTAAAPLAALAVSPAGALAWTEPAPAPATGQILRSVFGEGGTSTIATSTTEIRGLVIDRTEIRWTDEAGSHAASIPARSVKP